MKIAAFDLGTTWAVAANDSEKAVLLGTGEATHYLETGKRPEKLAGFAKTIADCFLHCELDVVVYERPFTRGQAATRLLWGMAGILEAAAHAAGIAVLDITPAEIKKWATGRGDATKWAMLDRASELGYTGSNEHEADAYCLLKFAEATLTKEPA